MLLEIPPTSKWVSVLTGNTIQRLRAKSNLGFAFTPGTTAMRLVEGDLTTQQAEMLEIKRENIMRTRRPLRPTIVKGTRSALPGRISGWGDYGLGTCIMVYVITITAITVLTFCEFICTLDTSNTNTGRELLVLAEIVPDT
eukprot:3265537-Rhodomonas_salina.1